MPMEEVKHKDAKISQNVQKHHSQGQNYEFVYILGIVTCIYIDIFCKVGEFCLLLFQLKSLQKVVP